MAELTKQLAQYRAGMDKVNDALKESQQLNAKLIEGIGQTVLAYDKVIQSSAKYSRSQKKDAKEAAKAMAKSVDAQQNEMSGLQKFVETKLRAQEGMWGGFHRIMYNVTGYFKLKNTIDVTLSSIDRLISKKKELRAADGKKGFGYFSGEYAKAEEIMNRMSDSRKKIIGKREKEINRLESKITNKPQKLASLKDKKQLLKMQNEYGDLFNKTKKSEEAVSKLKGMQQEAIKLKSKANVELPKPNDPYEEGNSKNQAQVFLLQKKIQHQKAKMGHQLTTRKPIVIDEKTTKAIDNNKAIAKKALADKKTEANTAHKLKVNELILKTQKLNLGNMGKINNAFKSSMVTRGVTRNKGRLKKLKEGTTALKDKPNSMNTNMKNFATYFSGDTVAKGASKLNRKDIKAGLKAGKQHLKNAKMKDLVDAIGKKFGIKKIKKLVMPILQKVGLMAMVVMKSIFLATLALFGLYLLWKGSGLKWANFKAAYEAAKKVAIQFGGIIYSGLKSLYDGFLLIKKGFQKGGSFEDVLRGLWKIWVGVFKIVLGVLGLLLGTALVFLGELLFQVMDNIRAKIAKNAEVVKKIALIIIVIAAVIGLIALSFLAIPTLLAGVAITIGQVLLGVLAIWAASMLGMFDPLIKAMKESKVGKMMGMATGGIAKGGMTLVGEEGPELVDLPKGAKVHTNAQTKGMVGGSVVNNITVNVQGRVGSSDNELRQIAEKVGAMINKEINRTTSSSTTR